MTTTIADMELWLAANLQAQKTERERHESEMARLRLICDQIAEQRDLALHGVDPEDLVVAKSVIFVHGAVEESVEGAFAAAVEMIARLGDGLETEYVGAKRYDGFHQRIRCSYGTVPSHGNVVFAVGLSDDVRRRQRATGGPLLTGSEADAAIRWLHGLRLIAESHGRTIR